MSLMTVSATRGLLAALLAVSLSGAAAAAEETPLVIPEEASAIRQSLGNGWSAERAGEVKAGEALNNYRKAAFYGSSEGYYRAAKLALGRRGDQPGAAGGVCLLQVASQLGHREAGELIATLARQKPELVRKCNDATMRQALSI